MNKKLFQNAWTYNYHEITLKHINEAQKKNYKINRIINSEDSILVFFFLEGGEKGAFSHDSKGCFVYSGRTCCLHLQGDWIWLSRLLQQLGQKAGWNSDQPEPQKMERLMWLVPSWWKLRLWRRALLSNNSGRQADGCEHKCLFVWMLVLE